MAVITTVTSPLPANEQIIGADIRILATFLFVFCIVCGITAIFLAIFIPIKMFGSGGRGGRASSRSRSRII